MADAITWVLSLLHLLVFAYLLLWARRLILSQMPLLFVCICWALSQHLLIKTLWLLGGLTGPLYFHVYYVGCLIHFGFLTGLIIDIHRGCRLRWTWRSSLMVALFMSVFLGHFLLSRDVSASAYVLAITLLLHIQAFLCAALNLALAYSSGVKLGRVRGAVLWAVTASTMLNYVVYMTPAYDLLPYALMRHLIPWVSLVFWLLLLYGMRFKPEEAFQTARPKTRTT